MSPVPHEARLRTAHISTANEALALPWIEKLPGRKRIQFVHGQIFVMQHYLGCKVIRAHILRNDEKCASHSEEQGCPDVIVLNIPSRDNKDVVVAQVLASVYGELMR